MDFYGHMVPRINGGDIDREFDRHLSLVRKGIAGFIIFGGEMEKLRRHIRLLQDAALVPLIVCSDLEQGLGQQVLGGTLFPPAMGLASAARKDGGFDRAFLEGIWTVFAREALYAGINTILAPVADINTNPDNPIISVRSFGEDRETVSLLAGWMTEALQSSGVSACVKHFPGHGDTSVDSHISLPVLGKPMDELHREELFPFRDAVDRGVHSMMLAHMAVPALDDSGTPVSVSKKAVRFIREDLRYDGLLMTDALNMGGLSGTGEGGAGFAALEAGVDILLHPSDPEGLNSLLRQKGTACDPGRILEFRSRLSAGYDAAPDFHLNRLLASKAARKSLFPPGRCLPGKPSSILILKESESFSSGIFENFLKNLYPGVPQIAVKDSSLLEISVTGNNALTIVYSKTAAWKGDTAPWLRNAIRQLEDRTLLYVSFGNPFIMHGIKAPKILTYWCSAQIEQALVDRFGAPQ